MITDERREELMATVTTYRMVDGQEVDRRHYYPMVAIKVNFRKVSEAFKAMAPAADRMVEAFGRMYEVTAFDPHKSVTLRLARPDRGASADTACPTPTMRPTPRGTAGLG